MYNLTKKEKLKFVLETIPKMELTAYDIAKNTSLTEAGILRILNGTTKNPQENTLNAIILYLEKKQLGSNLKENNSQNKVEESNAENYKIEERNNLRDLVECEKNVQKLTLEVIKLQNILRTNNIIFDDFFVNENS